MQWINLPTALWRLPFAFGFNIGDRAHVDAKVSRIPVLRIVHTASTFENPATITYVGPPQISEERDEMPRMPHTAFTAQPWRIHEITRDFRVEDVWAFTTPGAGPGDFPSMLEAMRNSGGLNTLSLPTRFLFAFRWRLGSLFGWDEAANGVGQRVPSLRDRLPLDLAESPSGPDSPTMPLRAVYELDIESARELVNKTVHTVMHLGWVPGDEGDHELQMTVLVKPNGSLGRLYMSAIAPFRYLVVYPALTRRWEGAWRRHYAASAS